MHLPGGAASGRGRSATLAVEQRLQALLSAPDRLLWAVRVRWLSIVGFTALALTARLLGVFRTSAPVLLVAVLGAGLNAVNGWCVRRRRHVLLISAIAIPFDHAFITYLVVQTGGAQSPFLMLYVVQVLATAMLVDRLVAAASALLSMSLWLAGVSLQAAGYVHGTALFAPGTANVLAWYHATVAAFLLYCLSLLVYVGGYVAERLRASEHDLHDKNRRLQDALASLRSTHDELGDAYERLKRTEAHLIQSEKMRSLGQLVAGVAHELNNPISFVSANVEHLRAAVESLRQLLDAYDHAAWPAAERARLDELRRALRIDRLLADLPGLLDDCEEGARRTKSIVNDLKTFSRSDAHAAWQATDLHRAIDGTLGILAHRLKDRITVHRRFGDLPKVECLPGQLNQVFMNLLINAADAIGERSGNIWISTESLADGATATGAEPRVRIAIRDDGPGMSPQVQARLFEPFFTTKDVGQGTGLGLSVSYGVVQHHRGTLTVDTAPGAGATFFIALPVRQPGTR